jgi:hypothetical protein
MRLAVGICRTKRPTVRTDSLYPGGYPQKVEALLLEPLVSWDGFGLAEIHLRRALRQDGCPVCRCVAEAERRYIWFLLSESVNDISTRRRLAQSMGLCALHATLMLTMEIEEWGTPLGTSIIYEGLAGQLLHHVQEARELLAQHPGRAGQTWWRGIGGRGAAKAAKCLTPQKICRVCEIGQESAKHYAETLADMVAIPQFQEMYASSAGVCLPHLRLMVSEAPDSPGLDYLLERASARLTSLRDALKALQDDLCTPSKTRPADNFRALREALSFFTGAEAGFTASFTYGASESQDEQKNQNLL